MPAETAERALAAIKDHWTNIGLHPGEPMFARVRLAVESCVSSGGYGTHWQSVVDDALAQLEWSADWDGQRIRDISVWGAPPRPDQS